MRWLKRITLAVFAALALIAVIYEMGPRVAIATRTTFDDSKIGSDPEAYLAGEEARIADIRPGLQKQIIWADPIAKPRTGYAVVYIHGFSASSGEVRPLPDRVARALHANLFYTRLQGHGRSGPDAMGAATLAGWLDDYAEAIAIGRRIGRQVIVISTSTGGTLTTWGLAQADLARDVAAAIFISPNYGLRAQGEFLLRGPWARQLSRLILGKRAGFTPENAEHARLWTTDYPVAALLPMAQSIKLATDAAAEGISTPALFIISSADQVVRPDRTRAIAARWGGPHDLDDVGAIGTGSNHVIAGDALSPKMTAPLAERILGWLKSLSIQAE